MAEGNPIDAVGYRRPPRNRQFKPGQSGNPTGRPKGAKNFATALAEELDAPITATENGKRKTISKREALAKQLVNKAIAGDAKAIPLLLNEMRLRETSLEVGDTLPELAHAEDDIVMAGILRRIRAADTETVVPEQKPEPSAEAQSEGSATAAIDSLP
jgi:hypothetical protein